MAGPLAACVHACKTDMTVPHEHTCMQELLGHCMSVYQSNHAAVQQLETHLKQYGYQSQGQLLAPEDPMLLVKAQADEDGACGLPVNIKRHRQQATATTLSSNASAHWLHHLHPDLLSCCWQNCTATCTLSLAVTSCALLNGFHARASGNEGHVCSLVQMSLVGRKAARRRRRMWE